MTSYLLGNIVFSARLAFLPALSLSKCRKIFLICGFSLRYFTRAAGVVYYITFFYFSHIIHSINTLLCNIICRIL